MKIEMLTDVHRDWLQRDPATGQLALRCIDQRDAEIARLAEALAAAKDTRSDLWDALRERAAAAEQKLAAAERDLRQQESERVDAIGAAANVEARVRELERHIEMADIDRRAAESEVAQLRERAEAAEQKLAAANALLDGFKAGYNALPAIPSAAQWQRLCVETMATIEKWPKCEGVNHDAHRFGQPAAPEPRDAEIARLKASAKEALDEWSRKASEWALADARLRNEVARLKEALAAARRREDWQWQRAEAAEQKLAAAERREESLTQRLLAAEVAQEAAEQKLAATEKERDEYYSAGLRQAIDLEAAEARVRELEVALAGASADAETELAARNAAESELAQLRERVTKADELLRTSTELDADTLARQALGALRGQ